MIDARLVNLNFTAGEEKIFFGRLGDIRRHLDLLPLSPKIHFAFLDVVFVDYFLILVPDKICFGGAEVAGSFVQLTQHMLEAGFGL